MSNNLDELKEKEQNSSERNSSLIMAIVFIIAGAALIARNVIGFEFDNWWVLFMLIPLGFFIEGIYQDFQKNDRLTEQSTGYIIVALAILASAVVFLFEAISWSMIWPIGLIIAGVAMFLGNRS